MGALAGLLIGLGTIAIPGIRPIMLAGTATRAIATTMAGGAIGTATGSLIGRLFNSGIPQEEAKVNRTNVAESGYLVIVEGTIDEIQLAEAILLQHNAEQWEVYDAFETERIQNRHLRIMGVFAHLAETKTALIELINIGYPLKQVTLFINGVY